MSIYQCNGDEKIYQWKNTIDSESMDIFVSLSSIKIGNFTHKKT